MGHSANPVNVTCVRDNKCPCLTSIDLDQPIGRIVTKSSLPYNSGTMVTDGLTNVIALLNSREFLAVIHDFYFGNISQLLRIPNTTVYTIKRA